MDDKKYQAKIVKPILHTTTRGGSFVSAFDVLRSEKGRDVVDRHAAIPRTCPPTQASPEKPTKKED